MQRILMLFGALCIAAPGALAGTCSEKTQAQLTSILEAKSPKAPGNEGVVNKICAPGSQLNDDFINELLNRGLTPEEISKWTEKGVTPEDMNMLLNARPSSAQAGDFWTHWSIGIGLLRNQPPVVDATIVNGNMVRANSTQKYQTDLLVARHWYFGTPDGPDSTCKLHPLGTCVGLMIAAGLASGNQVIDMLGAGIAIGFGNNINGQDRQKQPHNIGFGWGRRFNVKMPGDGFVLNAPPPPGETQVRTQTTDINAPFFFYTYNFQN